jgi:hypothetical protein
MYLGNPLLPLNLSVDKALSKIKKVLKEKNWDSFDLGEMKLVLVPYFYFNYHYYKEKESEGEKVVEASGDGVLSLNAFELKIQEVTTKLIKENIEKAKNEAPEIEFSQLASELDKKEVKNILTFKTAEYLKLPKQNIVISSIKNVFMPIYETFITINKKTHKININAVSGEVLGIEQVPAREKGFIELTQETLNDLSKPENWLKYSKEILLGTGKKAKEKTKDTIKVQEKKEKSFMSIFEKKWFIILIIILALFLIFLALFN